MNLVTRYATLSLVTAVLAGCAQQLRQGKLSDVDKLSLEQIVELRARTLAMLVARIRASGQGVPSQFVVEFRPEDSKSTRRAILDKLATIAGGAESFREADAPRRRDEYIISALVYNVEPHHITMAGDVSPEPGVFGFFLFEFSRGPNGFEYQGISMQGAS
jgi:hypothetical protein